MEAPFQPSCLRAALFGVSFLMGPRARDGLLLFRRTQRRGLAGTVLAEDEDL
jgi:hypothetical protein